MQCFRKKYIEIHGNVIALYVIKITIYVMYCYLSGGETWPIVFNLMCVFDGVFCLIYSQSGLDIFY